MKEQAVSCWFLSQVWVWGPQSPGAQGKPLFLAFWAPPHYPWGHPECQGLASGLLQHEKEKSHFRAAREGWVPSPHRRAESLGRDSIYTLRPLCPSNSGAMRTLMSLDVRTTQTLCLLS